MEVFFRPTLNKFVKKFAFAHGMAITKRSLEMLVTNNINRMFERLRSTLRLFVGHFAWSK